MHKLFCQYIVKFPSSGSSKLAVCLKQRMTDYNKYYMLFIYKINIELNFAQQIYTWTIRISKLYLWTKGRSIYIVCLRTKQTCWAMLTNLCKIGNSNILVPIFDINPLLQNKHKDHLLFKYFLICLVECYSVLRDPYTMLP